MHHPPVLSDVACDCCLDHVLDESSGLLGNLSKAAAFIDVPFTVMAAAYANLFHDAGHLALSGSEPAHT